jgi:hypothetical protein
MGIDEHRREILNPLAAQRIGYEKPDQSASASDIKYGDRPFFLQFGFHNLLRDDLGEGKAALVRTPVAEAARQGHELELFAPWHRSLELRRKGTYAFKLALLEADAFYRSPA